MVKKRKDKKVHSKIYLAVKKTEQINVASVSHSFQITRSSSSLTCFPSSNVTKLSFSSSPSYSVLSLVSFFQAGPLNTAAAAKTKGKLTYRLDSPVTYQLGV
jgi:hypothetical protein